MGTEPPMEGRDQFLKQKKKGADATRPGWWFFPTRIRTGARRERSRFALCLAAMAIRATELSLEVGENLERGLWV